LGGGDEVTGAGGGGGGEAPGQPARCGRGARAASTVVRARERSPGGTGAAGCRSGSRLAADGGRVPGVRAPGLAACAGGWRAGSAGDRGRLPGCAGAGARCGRGRLASVECGGRRPEACEGRWRLPTREGRWRLRCLREGRTRSQVPGRRKNQTFFAPKDVHAEIEAKQAQFIGWAVKSLAQPSQPSVISIRLCHCHTNLAHRSGDVFAADSEWFGRVDACLSSSSGRLLYLPCMQTHAGAGRDKVGACRAKTPEVSTVGAFPYVRVILSLLFRRSS